MAEDTATPASDVADAQQRPSQSRPRRQPEAAPRYSRDDLMESSRSLLDCSPHALAGALAGDDRQSFTLEEAAEKVNAYMGGGK